MCFSVKCHVYIMVSKHPSISLCCSSSPPHIAFRCLVSHHHPFISPSFPRSPFVPSWWRTCSNSLTPPVSTGSSWPQTQAQRTPPLTVLPRVHATSSLTGTSHSLSPPPVLRRASPRAHYSSRPPCLQSSRWKSHFSRLSKSLSLHPHQSGVLEEVRQCYASCFFVL